MTVRRLAPIKPEIATALAEVSSAAAAAFSSASSGLPNVAAALEVAGAIEDLRAQFDQTEIRQRIIALQDSPLGFRTDRDPKTKRKKRRDESGPEEYNTPYGWEVVRDCSIEATLRGLQLVGNQFNIISSRAYVTKEGFEYLIRRLAHVSAFKPIIGVPRTLNGGALVECEATWMHGNVAQSLKVTIPVKGDDFSGADQLIGKATRKFLRRCYEMMTGQSVPEGDAADEGAIDVDATVKPAAEDPTVPRRGRPPGSKSAAPAEQANPPATPPQPAAPVPPTATTPPPLDPHDAAEPTPQEALAGFVISSGFNFDHLLTAGKTLACLSTVDQNATNFDELLAETCRRMLNAKRGILRALTIARDGVQS